MLFYKFIRFIVRPICMIWFNPKIIGKENIPTDGPVIIACNHVSMIDPCWNVITAKRVIHYMAKDKYVDKKILGYFFKWMGCIKVKTNVKNDEAVKEAINVLNNKEVLGIFPEGTRNKTNEILLPFKYGAVSMAKKTNALIVPVCITGDIKFRSKNLMIRYGKPFKVENDLTVSNDKLVNEILKLIKQNKKES